MREELIKAIERELYLPGLRYMFLRLQFPHVLRFIRLDGSNNVFSCHLVSEFKKHGRLNELAKVFNKKFGYDIIIEK